MMLLDVILLNSLLTRLNITLSVENYVDINKAALQNFLLYVLLHTLLMHHTLMVFPLLLVILVNMYGAMLLGLVNFMMEVLTKLIALVQSIQVPILQYM